jgi:glycerol kinase
LICTPGGPKGTVAALDKLTGAVVWRSTDALASHWQAERRFHPTMARDRAQALLADWSRAVDQCAPA